MESRSSNGFLLACNASHSLTTPRPPKSPWLFTAERIFELYIRDSSRLTKSSPVLSVVVHQLIEGRKLLIPVQVIVVTRILDSDVSYLMMTPIGGGVGEKEPVKEEAIFRIEI